MSRPKILLTGCFDILTHGHLRLIQWAAQLGEVHVWIDSDASIKQLDKGDGRPICDEVERVDALNACGLVEEVGVFEGPGAAEAITKEKPMMWVKGGDYLEKNIRDDELDALREVRAALCIAPLFQGPGTSAIVDRIREGRSGAA